MTNLFTQLQEAKEQQDQVLQAHSPLPAKPGKVSKHITQEVAQKTAQLSKPLSKQVSNRITQEAVEELAFQLRRTQQAKINANVPIAWKEKLDELAYRLKVGKYELLTYIVGVFLGEVGQTET